MLPSDGMKNIILLKTEDRPGRRYQGYKWCCDNGCLYLHWGQGSILICMGRWVLISIIAWRAGSIGPKTSLQMTWKKDKDSKFHWSRVMNMLAPEKDGILKGNGSRSGCRRWILKIVSREWMKSPRERVENSLGIRMTGDVGNEGCKLGGRPKRDHEEFWERAEK